MSVQEWRYPVREPRFEESGDYEAWIAGSAGPQGSASAAAFLVQPVDKPREAIVDAVESEHASTAPRAILAAFVRAIECLPVGSTIVVHTRSAYVGLVATRAECWKASEFKKSGSKEHYDNLDIVNRFLDLKRNRQLYVIVKHARKGNSEHDVQIESLQELARSTLE